MSEDVTLSIVVPTVGRPTLARTLASIEPQLCPGDEVIVCGAVESVEPQPWRRLIPHPPGAGGKGDAERNHAMTFAKGSWLLFQDDDDCYTPGALEVIRAKVAGTDLPHLFRMRYTSGLVLWRNQHATYGNVSTQMIVCPNDPARLGRWREGDPAGDAAFILETIALHEGRVAWHEEVIALIRPE